MVLGIDPGLNGTIACVTSSERLVSAFPLPTTGKTDGKRTLDARHLASTLSNVASGRRCVAVLEQVSAMPGQGVTSMFTFGRTLGKIEGVLEAAGIPIVWALPRVWTKWAHEGIEGTTPKLRTEEAFRRAFGIVHRPKGTGIETYRGMMDAAMMALWAIRTGRISAATEAPADAQAPAR